MPSTVDRMHRMELEAGAASAPVVPQPEVPTVALSLPQMRQELLSIRGLLVV